MHSSTIATIFTLAIAVTAMPTGGSTGNAPTCSTHAVNKCCDGFTQTTLGGILSNIGLGCTNVIGSTCTSGTAACCSDQNQNGLIIANVCALPVGA